MAFIRSDTRFNQQWHLLNDAAGQFDLNNPNEPDNHGTLVPCLIGAATDGSQAPC